MRKLFIVCILGIMSATLFSTSVMAQDVTNNDVKIGTPAQRVYKDTDWILLGQTKAYKAVENQITGELYVRYIAGKFFYKFVKDNETYVVSHILSTGNKNLDFQPILSSCNATFTTRAGVYYLAVPTW